MGQFHGTKRARFMDWEAQGQQKAMVAFGLMRAVALAVCAVQGIGIAQALAIESNGDPFLDGASIEVKPFDDVATRGFGKWTFTAIGPDTVIGAIHELVGNGWQQPYAGYGSQAAMDNAILGAVISAPNSSDFDLRVLDYRFQQGQDKLLLRVGIAGQNATLPTWVNLENRRVTDTVIGSYGPTVMNGSFGTDLHWGSVGAVSIIPGDSSSGQFYLDGLDWRLKGITLDSTNNSLSDAESDWIRRQMVAMGSTIAVSPQQVAPTADVTWTGITNRSWGEATNWTNGLPTASDSVVVDTAPRDIYLSDPTVAAAKNLYVGTTGQNAITQASGTLAVSESLYLGVNPSASAIYSLNGGTLSAAREYVGYKGTGSIVQGGGTHSISGTLSIGRSIGSSGSYNLSGSGSVLSVGTMIVGEEGTGTFVQSDGQVTAADTVQIGAVYGASGAYLQASGSLNAGKLNIDHGFLYSLGTIAVGYIEIGDEGSLKIGGGTVTANGVYSGDGVTASGTIDFMSGSGTLSLPADDFSDLSGASVLNTASATLNVGDNSLVILPANVSPSAFGQITGNGIVHQLGADLVMPSGAVVSLNPGRWGTIVDPLQLSTGAQIIATYASINVPNLKLMDAGSVLDAGSGTVTIAGTAGSATLNDVTLSGGTVNVPDGTTATISNSSIVGTNMWFKSGSVATINNSSISTSSLNVEQSSHVEVHGGSITLGGGTFAASASGQLVIDGVTVNGTASLWVLPGGTLTANGSATGLDLHLTPGGTLEVGPTVGSLAVNSLAFITGSVAGTGHLQLGIAGPPSLGSSASDTLDITGTADFGNDGSGSGMDLTVVSEDGFQTLPGDTYQLIQYGSLVNPFVSETFETTLLGLHMGVTYGTNDLTVTFSAHDGDVDLDGFVGGSDEDIILSHWGQIVGSRQWMSGDLNGDGFVGMDDLNLVLGNWGYSGMSQVPEPTSLGLNALGFFAVATRRRRARREPRQFAMS